MLEYYSIKEEEFLIKFLKNNRFEWNKRNSKLKTTVKFQWVIDKVILFELFFVCVGKHWKLYCIDLIFSRHK